MAERQSLRDLQSGTVANIAIILAISVLAIRVIEEVIQPLVIAVLLFLLIRPAAQWLEERPLMQGKYAHPLMPYGVLVALLFVVLWIASQVLYANVTAFTEEVPMLTEKLNEKVVWFEGISVMGYSFDISGLTELFSVETINEYIGDFVGSLASFTTRAATVLIFLLSSYSRPRRSRAGSRQRSRRTPRVSRGSPATRGRGSTPTL